MNLRIIQPFESEKPERNSGIAPAAHSTSPPPAGYNRPTAAAAKVDGPSVALPKVRTLDISRTSDYGGVPYPGTLSFISQPSTNVPSTNSSRLQLHLDLGVGDTAAAAAGQPKGRPVRTKLEAPRGPSAAQEPQQEEVSLRSYSRRVLDPEEEQQQQPLQLLQQAREAEEESYRSEVLPSSLRESSVAPTEVSLVQSHVSRVSSLPRQKPAPVPTAAPRTQPPPQLPLQRRPSPSVASRASTAASVQTTRRRAPRLPAREGPRWVEGLVLVATAVWGELGLFHLQPLRADPQLGDDDEEDEPTAKAAATGCSPHDAARFVEMLRQYYLEGEAADAATMEQLRNGLWQILYNGVHYSMSALDTRRDRTSPAPPSELEVRTGGVEDQYEVVFDAAEGDNVRYDRARSLPVRLSWTGSEGEGAAAAEVLDEILERRRRSAVRRDASPNDDEDDLEEAEGAEEGDTTHFLGRGRAARTRRHTELYGGRLRLPLPTVDWYFVLRCMGQVGYRRDRFYIQTPTLASLHELVLALLWLTRRYQWIAVAEHIELNRRYRFLLQRHIEDAHYQGEQPLRCGQRLQFAFPGASAWPPVSFDENEAIQHRLQMIDRLLGPITPAEGAAHASTRPSAVTRRLLAAQRLISLSLHRLEHLLHQRAEQAAVLGHHSCLDVELCLPEHDEAYREVLAGLDFVSQTEARVRERAESLRLAGCLAAFYVRNEPPPIPLEELFAGLEEDDATWLTQWERDAPPAAAAAPHSSTQRATRAAERGQLPAKAGERLHQLQTAVQQFRATRTASHFVDLWKTMWRQVQVGGAESAISPESEAFLLDPQAQEAMAGRVETNMRHRYSLQSALAAEVLILQVQQRRRLRGQGRAPPPAGQQTYITAAGEGSRRPSSVSQERSRRRSGGHAPPPPPVLASMPLQLRTAAAALHAQRAAGSLPLSGAEMQAVEVGQPAAGATTSARVEQERLSSILGGMQRAAGGWQDRLGRCHALLKELYQVYGLRMVAPRIGQEDGSKEAAK